MRAAASTQGRRCSGVAMTAVSLTMPIGVVVVADDDDGAGAGLAGAAYGLGERGVSGAPGRRGGRGRGR